MCSNEAPETRIVGGSDATEGQFPYMVELFYGGVDILDFTCGASILDETTILTAGHCVHNRVAGSFNVLAGQFDRAGPDTSEQMRTVSEIREHASFNPLTLNNDIALLKLTQPLTFNSVVSGLTLPTQDPAQMAFASNCIVSGWGTTSSGGTTSRYLQYVDVPFITDPVCEREYTGFNSAYMMCAGREGVDSCQGDSGGPLYCENEQHGIVSWGSGCAEQFKPGVYTRIFQYLDWIAANRS